MAEIQPQRMWVDQSEAAVQFYQAAFGAWVPHRLCEGDDIVAQRAVGDAAFWDPAGLHEGAWFGPQVIGGAASDLAASTQISNVGQVPRPSGGFVVRGTALRSPCLLASEIMLAGDPVSAVTRFVIDGGQAR